MRTRPRSILTAAIAGFGLLGLGATAVAAPPNNFTNYNLDISTGFNDGPYQVEMEAHGNDPDQWPTEVDVYFAIAYDGDVFEELCVYGGSAAVTTADSTVTVHVPDCGDVVVTHMATTYRAHWNETGNQCKASGVRDESADVDVVDFGVTASNVAFYQAVSEQCHSTGSPGNPQP